ncbi:MAG: tRNA pseudouridine(55) synthase TruB [Acidimicrobiales bacterium]
MSGPEGLAVIDKPAGWTSHDVVAKARGVLRTKRVGHAGTLDPDATGVLLLGVGRVTRLLRYLTALPKTYAGEVVLGSATDTLDDSGQVLAEFDMSYVTAEQAAAAAAAFVGDIWQVPPMVSAVKVGGRRLHELARAGVEVEREARRVRVHDLSVAPTPDPLVYAIELTCSSGVYVRTIADDLGRALAGGAHLRRLRRRSIGSFDLAEACPLDALTADALMTPAEALRDYPSVVVDAGLARQVGQGAVLSGEALGAPTLGPVAVLDQHGGLLAVYEPHRDDQWKPSVVLVASSPPESVG